MITLEAALARVEAHCNEWNHQYTQYHPQEIERRRSHALKAKQVVQAVLGLAVYPRFLRAEKVFLFEGIRNKEYMSTFDPRFVFVIGSHHEREFAKARGYGFVWSFPIDAAIRARIYRGVSLFAYMQLAMWRRALSRRKDVIFYLYEDTQPLGTFFVEMACLLKNAKTVCIQHGYFSELKHPLRYEGALSDINFVWDEKQGQLMAVDPATTFAIGLPYVAQARRERARLTVVIVGDGAPHGDPFLYKSLVDAFYEISKIAEDELGLDVVYRPHPNESAHVEVIEELRKRFKFIDRLEKLARLSEPQSIYIGTVSSLLYEAKQAGHFVVSIQIQDKEKPIFDRDLTLRPDDLRSFASWTRSLVQRTDLGAHPEISEAAVTPLARFRAAVIKAKLPLC